jgi:hypothetical protein
VTMFLTQIVLSILGIWICSNVVARETGSILNALKLWLVYTVGLVLTSLLIGIGIAVTGMAQSAGGSSVVVLIFFLLTVLIGVGGPIVVYSIGFLRAVGFVVMVLVVSLAGQLLINSLQLQPKGFIELAEFMSRVERRTPEERKAFVEALQKSTPGSASPGPAAVAADRSKTIEERHAALQFLYSDLEKRRKELQLGDSAALDAYNRDNARYQELLKQLQTEAAAPR